MFSLLLVNSLHIEYHMSPIIKFNINLAKAAQQKVSTS